MKQHLAVSAIGSDRTGMVHDLTRVISDCGGSISESRMASLGNEFAMLVLVTGNWHSPRQARKRAHAAGRVHRPVAAPEAHRAARARAPTCCPIPSTWSASTRPASSPGLSGFFASRGIDIAEVSTRSYPAAHTGAQMFAVQMIINVPKRLQLAHLREEFMDYCDSQNLDAILEPVKS